MFGPSGLHIHMLERGVRWISDVQVLGVDSMKRVLTLMMRSTRTLALVALSLATLWPNGPAFAQGVTTGALNGIVTNDQKQPIQGASVIAIHLPSGTNYETVTRADGRFTI